VKHVAGLCGLLLLLGISACYYHGHRRRHRGETATVLVAEGFQSPVWVGSAPGDLDRLFVVERMGRIRIIELHEHDERGDILSTPFLDLGGGVPRAR
jgi:hypothetical protein